MVNYLFRKESIYSAGIIGTGTYFPPRRVTNKELENLVDTTDEWIITKTGIKERRFACSELALSDLAIPAARKALEDAKIAPSEIDFIITGAMSHDYPATLFTGNLVKKAIGAEQAFAIDLNIICGGVPYCLEIAASMIESGRYKTGLIINGEIFSKYPHSRVTSVIFGDGAAAAVVSRVKKGYGLIGSVLGSKADGAENLGIFVGGSKKVFSQEVIESGEYHIHMNGRPIFEFAVDKFENAIKQVLEKTGTSISKIKYVFPHQANLNIIKEGMRMLGLPMNKTITNVQRHGNIGGGSVLTVIDEANRGGKLHDGDLIVTVAFGSGLSWGANVLRWYKKNR